MRQVQAQLAAHGTAWFAHYQNAGKGQRGKTWQALAGENITMSVALEPTGAKIEDQFLLSAAVALACFDFVKTISAADFSIKWPNDLYWGDKKAGGILIENVLKGLQWRFAIAGMGININQASFPTHLQQATSLHQITGVIYNTVNLAKQLCGFLQHRWQQFSDEQFETILTDYNNCLYKKNCLVSFKHNENIFEAKVLSVAYNGDLVDRV